MIINVTAFEELFECELEVFVDKKKVTDPVDFDLDDGVCNAISYREVELDRESALAPDAMFCLPDSDVKITKVPAGALTRLEGKVATVMLPKKRTS